MSLMSDETVDALKEMERDMGSKVVTVAGVDYPCTPTRGQIGGTLGAGGFSISNEFSFYIRKALVETLPKSNQPVVFEDRNLKISPEGVSISSDGAYVIVACVASAQRL